MNFKTLQLPLLLWLLFQSCQIDTIAQSTEKSKLYLKSGTVSLPENIAQLAGARSGLRISAGGESTFVIIQFKEIPDQDQRDRLQHAGISLLEYIPDNAYTASFTGVLNVSVLADAGARSIFQLTAEQKIDPILLNGPVPDHAENVPGKVDVRVSYPKTFSYDWVSRDLQRSGFEIVSGDYKQYQILELRVSPDSIKKLASLAWVQYIEPIPAPAQPLNDKSLAGTRANVLNPGALLGYNLTGEGVVIGIGDNASPTNHSDISSRVISSVNMSDTWHGVHVAGTMAGAGIINEKYKGYAPKSALVVRGSSQIWRNAPTLVQDFGMVITNNSYASGGTTYCWDFGYYTSDSYVLDRQAFELPFLQHVFATGNSGMISDCIVGFSGFGNILTGYASSKNTISVGQTLTTGVISPTSSKGPVRDGRIKPDITAPGTSIFSTMPGNTYQGASGTSMAAPAVAGGLALLYQRYRQLHGQNNPKNALIKALVCNGAADHGLPGPDYSHGFGQMNLLRSVDMLDKGRYFNGEIAHQNTSTHQITVPPNTARLKVMLYWNDPATSMLTGGQTLVNNLDLRLTGQGNTESLPQFPDQANPAAAATSGVDSLNNMEQISIENPAAGTYSLQVIGKMVPQGIQEYFLVYDLIETSMLVTYPAGGEHLTKGDVVNISWDAYGNASGNFSAFYSLNDGGSWTTINAAIEPGSSQLSWTVPEAATGEAKIRIVQNGTGTISESGKFSILGVPVVSFSAVQCEGYAAVQWKAVSSASDYEVMVWNGGEIRPVTVTTDLKYVLSGLSPDSTYYISVRARRNGVPGRRSVAIGRKPDNGSCEGSISDNDLKIDSIISPARSGRVFTSSGLSEAQQITIGIKNLDDKPVSRPFQVGYMVGQEGEVHWETIESGIPAKSGMAYTFTRKVDLSKIGEYFLKVFVQLDSDLVGANNSVAAVFKQLSNPKMTLPYFQPVESISIGEITSQTIGLPGADAYDFVKNGGDARLRTHVESGIAYSQANAFTLDAGRNLYDPGFGKLEGTFNLSGYDVQKDDVRLTFRYATYTSYYHYDVNRVYIRGSSADPWLLAYILNHYGDVYADIDNGYMLASVDVSDLLKRNAQQFSAEFQVSWASAAYEQFPEDGYSIDDIRLFKTTSDIETVKVDVPAVSVCDYYSSPRISAVFKNNGTDDCFNVPVKMSFAGAVHNESIPVIRKGSSVTVMFYYPSGAYQQGTYDLRVWAEKGSDSKPENDTVKVTLVSAGYISSFPYLENFESGNGGWYTAGKNSSWQFGRPGSAAVESAASGQNAWKTNLTGLYNDNEDSYLYSPCYYMGSMSQPTLSFSAMIDVHDSGNGLGDIAYIEHDYGYGWQILGAKGTGMNWYNKEVEGAGSWQGRVTQGWRAYTVSLPSSSYIRFRFVLKSDAAARREGFAIDDIHIYNLTNEIHDGAAAQGSTSWDVNANNWIPLTADGKIIASVHPQGQELGNLSVLTYVHGGEIQSNNNQYYLNRNFVIEPGDHNFSEPVGVRLYITESEMERLVAAPDNTGIDRPGSVYDLSVTKYSGANQDGELANNTVAGWSFYPQSMVPKVPYDKGYYLEFKTRSFSEFWLAKDFVGNGPALPVELVSFTAAKRAQGENLTSVVVTWVTSSEKNFSHFEVQVAVGAGNARNGLYSRAAVIEGKGASATQTYTFIDSQVATHATRYYRLKMVDADSSFRYSVIRAVNFDQPAARRIFPNPSKGRFNLELLTDDTGQMTISVSDITGRLLRESRFVSAGQAGQKEVDLSSEAFLPGLYLIRITSVKGEETYKLLKE